MRIVLADSQVDVRSALRVLLKHHTGMQVVGEAMDAESLAEQLDATRPDLLLLAWEVLGTHARQALSDLRSRYPDLRLIVMSGQPEVRHLAMAAGADAFVSKGSPPEQLLEALKKVANDIEGLDFAADDPLNN